MSSNVNLLSVGAGSTAKVSVKASNRTASSQGSDFSKTLDQAQQARSRDTAKPESDYKSVAKDESTKAEQPEATKPEAADSKAKADAANAANVANAANADTKPENAEGASDVQEKGEPDGQQPADGDGSTATDATPAAAMAAAMAEGVIATQGQQPLAELNTYFKGDARLRETPPGSAENAQQTAEQQFGGQKQPVQQFDGQKQPLDSLQAASAMEDMAPVTSDTLSVSQSSQAPQQPGLIVNAGDANIGRNTAMGRQAQVPQQPSDIIGSTGLSKVDVPSSTMPLQPLVEQKQPELQAAGIRQEVSSVDLPVGKGQVQVPQQTSDVIGSTYLSKSDVSSATMPLQPVQQFVEQKKPEQGIQPAKIMGEGATAGVPHESRQYVPNSIEALLGRRIIRQNVQHVSNANEGHVRTDNGQQLLNMLPGQRTFTTVQENSAVPQKENTVGINQLNDLVGQVEIVQGEGNSRGFAQQQNQNQQGGMANSQGQQQGMQMPGEAAFDVVVPGEEITQENSLGRSRQDNVASFQQILGNAQTTDNVGAINEPQQAQHTSRTYNVPQQIVEQAKLLQNGQNSEMIIKLNPEHLGELSLKVSVNGNGGVTATFHTDNAQVRAILETGMIQLKQLLNEQGIKVDSVEVQTGLPDGQLPDGQAQQGFYQQEQGQHVRSQQIDLKDFEDTSDALAAGTVNNAAADIHDSEGNVIASGVDYSV
ncbi:MAG: flagellar hook-length control protein FliK [Anaerovibrio sp.]|uniref:flagellar hook-length control protein FliK n=1 Tax=Anaerovibrio sp. TaxID=1872532 RepID=UPI0026327F35|nr:flagellar hook-length control protein FliK [Anaerovibrio sp.]MDD7677218.1 flagellar hook-length control protein FliK [Anaerovibrio sp.]MDY2602827.1 flagellar hook-length control protein FliK [Anaerovibrio sp.]